MGGTDKGNQLYCGMNKLLKVHKIILVSSFVVILLSVVVYINFGVPAQKSKKLSRQVNELRETLAGMGASADRDSLESMKSRARARRSELEENVGKSLELYQSLYVPAIQQHNWTLKSFVEQKPKPTRDMYMTEYERVIVQSPYGSLDGAEGMLGLSRDSDAEDRQRLLLQLWCLESLLSQAQACHLELVRQPSKQSAGEVSAAGRGRGGNQSKGGGAKKREVACLQVLAPVETGHRGRGDERRPGLLRLSFRIGLKGSLSEVAQFMHGLGSEGTFFGLGEFELLQLPPGREAEAGAVGPVQLNLECITFVPLIFPTD